MTAGGAALAADLRRFGTPCFPKDTPFGPRAAARRGETAGTGCRALGQPRSSQRYTPQLSEAEERLTESIVSVATKYGRYGYRRITTLLQREGWRVNHKRVGRIWRQEGLKLPQRQPKRARSWLNDASCIRLRPQHPGHLWSYDFVADRTHPGLYPGQAMGGHCEC